MIEAADPEREAKEAEVGEAGGGYSQGLWSCHRSARARRGDSGTKRGTPGMGNFAERSALLGRARRAPLSARRSTNYESGGGWGWALGSH